ncbi:MAG: hypothetical protein HRT61_12550 [Ekhidna sp.]|nr:hypothetical protein [Ekhidna sp.]
MKKLRITLALLSAFGLVFMSSCGDDEDPAVLGGLNITVEGLPSGVNAAITVIDEDDMETMVTGSTTLADLPLGLYIIEIAAVDNSGARYVSADSEIQVNLSDADAEVVTITYAEFSSVNGIVGTWVSKGDDVAALLTTFFAVDSIVATFSANQTYEVLQYAGGAEAPLTLTGTYAQTLSSVGTIWTITVDQSAPSSLTSEGIFEVDPSENPNSMRYEIAQTSPDIGAIPPTPEAGFGSTSGGAVGDTNIQVYKRRSF